MENKVFHNAVIILTYLYLVSCAILLAIPSMSGVYAKEIGCGVLGFIIYAHSFRESPLHLRSLNNEEAQVLTKIPYCPD